VLSRVERLVVVLVERVELELVERVERPVLYDIDIHSAVRSMVLVKADEYRQWPRTRGSGALCSAKLAARCGAGLK
jgi:hypothetical protein